MSSFSQLGILLLFIVKSFNSKYLSLDSSNLPSKYNLLAFHLLHKMDSSFISNSSFNSLYNISISPKGYFVVPRSQSIIFLPTN